MKDYGFLQYKAVSLAKLVFMNLEPLKIWRWRQNVWNHSQNIAV